MESKNYWTDPNYHNITLQRTLWLEVVWQKSFAQLKKYKEFEVRPGEVLERQQAHLEQFEVFRTGWDSERNRRTLREEHKTMEDCFVPVDI